MLIGHGKRTTQEQQPAEKREIKAHTKASDHLVVKAPFGFQHPISE